MSHRTSPSSYAAIICIPGAMGPFTAVALGRLSYSALPLTILITVQQATTSFAVAGMALGILSVATGLMPVKARLVDRLGPRSVLPVLTALFGAALIGVGSAATLGVDTTIVYLALACIAGLAAPPLGPTMRALWAELTPDLSARQRAYALDGTAEEIIQVAGPLTIAATLTVSSVPTTLALVAILNIVGALGLAFSHAARGIDGPTATTGTRGLAGPLRERGFLTLVLVVLGIGAGGAHLDVAIVARAQELSSPETAAYLLAIFSAGSAIGGILWGIRSHRRPTAVHLTALVFVMSAGSIAAGLASDLVMLGIIVLVAGLANAPVRIVAYLAADRLVPEGGRTEATTWVSTANNIGASLGLSFAGVLVEGMGSTSAMLGGGSVLAVVALAVLFARTRLSPGTRRSRPPRSARAELGHARGTETRRPVVSATDTRSSAAHMPAGQRMICGVPPVGLEPTLKPF